VGNFSTNVCAKFFCAPLCIKKALGIFRELIPRTRRTRTTNVERQGCVYYRQLCTLMPRHYNRTERGRVVRVVSDGERNCVMWKQEGGFLTALEFSDRRKMCFRITTGSQELESVG